jgi:putative ABC transport system permease protein
MHMNYQIKSIYRNLTRKPVYSIITFTGFTVSIVASLLIYIWVINELSYDKFHPGYNQIYRVLTLSKEGDKIIKSPRCYRAVSKTLKTDYPQIEYATYISYQTEDSPLQKESGGEKYEVRGCCTNEDFFKVFGGFRFTEGSSESALDKPDKIVLSEVTARKLFGNKSCLGKTLVSDKYFKEVYTIGGVIKIPEQSTIDVGYILSDKNAMILKFSNAWSDKGSVRVYIKLRKDAQIDKKFLSLISNHISRYAKISDKLMLQHLSDIHLYSDYPNYVFDKNQGSFKYVWIFSGLAFLIVLMASLNFSTLSIARASERFIEIGIKKTYGAGRGSVFSQFMMESALQIFLATAIGLFLVFLIIPVFNMMLDKHLTLIFSTGLIINLLFLTFTVGIIAGFYPSVYLSAFNPIGIFRGGSISGSRNNFIRILVTIQFTIAIFFIIATLLFIKQLNYIHNKDLGLDDKNILVIPTGLWIANGGSNEPFKEELRKNPMVISASASTYAPIDVGFRGNIIISKDGGTDTLQVNHYFVDEDFAKTYKIDVIKGQFFQMDYDGYLSKLGNPIVINETAEKLFGFADPIGQRVAQNVIVGVVKDFHFRSLYFPIEPLILSYNPEEINTMNVRIAKGNTKESLAYIRETYKKYLNGAEFSYKFFDDLLSETYKDETQLRNLILSFALLAILISVLGILGMVVFSTDRRTKEIGIRKVMGARNFDIILLFNREFLKWVVVSFIIASPIAWYVMHKWLQNFAYKTEFVWWIFVLAGLIAFAIALMTVNLQSWYTSTRNPVEALRNE